MGTRRWDDAAGVVTPEAVPLQFSEANVGSRGVAYFIDALALGGTLLVLNIAIGFLVLANAPNPNWVAVTALVLLNFLVLFGYPIGFETLWHGRTPGKAAMGLRVVTVEGAPVRFRHAAIRSALGLVDFFLTSGIAAVVATLLSRRHQRLGDMVAGTVVLRERSASGPPRAARFDVPAGAESYAATLDPSGLSPRDYETVREFLLRVHTLDPQARLDVGRRLASALAAKLHHTPPAGVSAELFLSCLAARYQQRGAAGGWAPPAGPPAQAPPPPPAPPRDDFAPPR